MMCEYSELDLIKNALSLTTIKKISWNNYPSYFQEEWNLPYYVIKSITPENIEIPKSLKEFKGDKIHYYGHIFALVERDGIIYTSLAKFSHRNSLYKSKNKGKKRKEYQIICNFILTGATIEEVRKVMYYIFKILSNK